MNTTDSIADLLTSIRNAIRAGHEKTEFPASRQREAVLKLLSDEGYVGGYKTVTVEKHARLQVKLKYDHEGEPVIGGLKRVSKPGRRVYRKAVEIDPVLGGMGMSIVSTSRGLMSDRQARESKLGGEVLFNIW
jgi:small subunit ribosomal protein S8